MDGLDGLDGWMDWMDPTWKSSPARAPSGANKVDPVLPTQLGKNNSIIIMLA